MPLLSGSKMNHNRAGQLAEAAARLYMRLHGYRIVAANVRGGRGTRIGETDFIACRGRILVFVEVKKRATLEGAAYAIKPLQQTRIRNAALNFCRQHPSYNDYDIRFDAVLIAFPCHIRHIENAWQ